MPQTCTTYKVNSGDSCPGIAGTAKVTFQQIIAWNPSINSYCSNLIAGTNICVSPPGGVKSLTTIAGASVTQTGVYATATVDRPSPVASGTTRKCGKYYQIQPVCHLWIRNTVGTCSNVFLSERLLPTRSTQQNN